jgi:hypothetical protein
VSNFRLEKRRRVKLFRRITMKYLLLIYGNEAREAALSQDEWQAMMEEHNSFSTKHGDSILGGEALEPTMTAKTLRRRGSDHVILDGPFAETKEQLGGFYIIEAPDVDQAVSMARGLPITEHDAIEVRPVMEIE